MSDREQFEAARAAGLKARHETRVERAIRREDPFTSLRECLAFSSNDWASAGDFAWLYGVISGWQDEEGDCHDELAAKFGWPPHQVERLRKLSANFAAASDLWSGRAAIRRQVAEECAQAVERLIGDATHCRCDECRVLRICLDRVREIGAKETS